MFAYEVESWTTPATNYPRKTIGTAAICNGWYKGHYDAYKVLCPKTGERINYFHCTKKTLITTLKINGDVWMVDDLPHYFAIQALSKEYHGNVLVAGLGLGLIIHCLRSNPKVKKITVIELNRDVIDLVGPYVPKCKLVCADWYQYEHRGKVDGVFFDLFVGEGKELLPAAFSEMLHLKKLYKNAIIRVLGFNNDVLNKKTDAILNAIDQTRLSNMFPNQK